MSSFLQGQTDYMLFVCSLGLGLLAAVCFALRRAGDDRLPWFWLGLYAALRAAGEWQQLVGPTTSRGDDFAALSACTLFFAQLCRLEFARDGHRCVKGREPRKWILLPFMALALLGGMAGWSGFVASTKYSLGLVGGLWGAYVVFVAARTTQGRARQGLLALSVVCMVRTAFASVFVDKAGFFPASVINEDWFASTIGIPTHILEALASAGMALALWEYYVSEHYHQSGRNGVRRLGAATAIIIPAILLIGWPVTNALGRHGESAGRDELLVRTTTAAAAINPDAAARLSVESPAAVDSIRPNIRRRLQAVHLANPDCRFVYLVGQRGGSVIFLADAEPANSPDYSPPGSVYEDASKELRAVFDSAEACTEGPGSDEWGTWISGLAPVFDAHRGRVVAVLGMDIDATNWLRGMARQRFMGILGTGLICLAVVAFLVIMQNKEESAYRISVSERRYRVLAENVADVMWEMDTEGRFTYISPAVKRFGYEQADWHGHMMTEFLPPDEGQRIQLLLADGLRNPGHRTREVRIYRKDGSIVWMEVAVDYLVENGAPVRIHGIARDIDERKRTEQALQFTQFSVDRASDPTFWVGPDGRFAYTNEAACRVLGYSRGELLSLHVWEVDPLLPKEKWQSHWKELEQKGSVTFESLHRCKDGRVFPVEMSTNYLDYSGKQYNFASARDITDRKRALAELRTQTSAIHAASDQIVIADVRGNVVFVNHAFERETGYSSDEMYGKNLRVLNSGKQDCRFYQELWNTILSGRTWHGEMTNRRKDGSLYTEDMTITPVQDESGLIQHFIAIKRNVTEKKIYEEQLDHLAHHDHLTGLPNRLLFGDRLTQRLAQAERDGTGLAVMFLDLDRFKLVNDTLGHNVGDQLLKEVAGRLAGCIRETDTISRMGGDEFTIILGGVGDGKDVTQVAKKILDSLARPFLLEDRDLFVSGSIGISLYPADGTDAETLVMNADTAMYRAKDQGRSTFEFYHADLNIAAVERMTIENDLRRGLDRGELVLHYQPKVNTHTGEVLGVEALVRWQHPEFGLMYPGQFIALAEETGLIIQVSKQVMQMACAQNKAWQEMGLPAIEVAVNVSPRELQQGSFVRSIKNVLKQTGLEPRYLGLELTETTLMDNPDTSVGILAKLKAMGVSIAVDDFGTGHSSLSYLKRLPIDAVKIDQSFVRDITSDPDDAAIAGAVVAMAHSLKLKVTAEGVETLEQLQFLRSLNCDEVQGYFVSRPVPADEITHILLKASPHSIRRAA